MTRLAIVSYPRFEDGAGRWIEAARKEHDPQASLLKAHFTLVFPLDAALPPVAEQATRIAAAARPARVVLRRAEAVPDALHGGGHVFLVPDEGRAEIEALHDRLYDGALRAHLRTDVPFVPHITVGAYAAHERCVALAAELNAQRPLVHGTVDSIEIIEVSVSEVRTLLRLELGKAKGGRTSQARE